MAGRIIKNRERFLRSGDEKPPSHQLVRQALLAAADSNKAAQQARFFKTGKGEYAEGERFLGISVPTLRRLAWQFQKLSLADCEKLLASHDNEARLIALFILVRQYQTGDVGLRSKVCRFYVNHRHRVNNWNLVDSSAPYLLGAHLLNRDRRLLYRLVRSNSVWDRRIAILATLAFIRAHDFSDTLQLTLVLLKDEQDLLHKACGWMLREVGKRRAAVLETFLNQHHKAMPRTMLRYAIERFPAAKRTAWLKVVLR